MSKKHSQKKNNTNLYSVYGARISASGKYVNLSLVNGEDDEKEWATACVKKKGKYIKVKVNDDTIVLTIPRLDVEDDEDEDEDEDEDDCSMGGTYDSEIANTPLTDEGLIPVDDNDLPFDK